MDAKEQYPRCPEIVNTNEIISKEPNIRSGPLEYIVRLA
jgi:hypothetical protein